MTTLAIIHTTPATLEPLKALAAEMLPGWDVFNLMDDSILPQLKRSGGDLFEVEDRWVHYAGIAERAGADVILGACSSVGELVTRAQAQVGVPIVRIDEAMAEEAVRRGGRIGVAATLPTTLDPTMRLLRQKAEAAGKRVELRPLLVEAAYQRLVSGDRDGHDSLMLESLLELARSTDWIVLAQASMARVVAVLPEAERPRFLSSPRFGMQRVKHAVERSG